MLKLENVTLYDKKQLILHNCSCNIKSQSIIVLNNNFSTSIVAQCLAGYKALESGEIYFTGEISSNKKNTKNFFFVISEDYHTYFKNYKIQDIYRILTKKKVKLLPLCKKYNIDLHDTLDSISNFQKIIFLISLGKHFKRNIFIFDQPTKYFDYDDLEKFEDFLNSDFNNESYIILTNRFEKIFSNFNKQIYYLNFNQLELFVTPNN